MEQPPNGRKPDQSIWGINPKDRIWFMTITAVAGTAWSAAIAVTAIIHRAPQETVDTTLTEIAVGTAGAYAAAGFIAWTILSAKDIAMSIADAIRERTAKHREAILKQGREEGREEGIEQGIEQGIELTLQKLIAQAESTGNPELREQIRKIIAEMNQNS